MIKIKEISTDHNKSFKIRPLQTKSKQSISAILILNRYATYENNWKWFSYSKIKLSFAWNRKEKADKHEGYNKPADKTYKNGKAKIWMLCGVYHYRFWWVVKLMNMEAKEDKHVGIHFLLIGNWFWNWMHSCCHNNVCFSRCLITTIFLHILIPFKKGSIWIQMISMICVTLKKDLFQHAYLSIPVYYLWLQCCIAVS